MWQAFLFHLVWGTEMLKLISFALGLMLISIGSFYENAIDWDIGVSVTMAVFTFFYAEWTIVTFRTLNWKMMIPSIIATWWTVDGCYIIYWAFMNPDALEMRSASIFPSLLLYLLCGFIWYALRPLDLHLYRRNLDQSHSK